MDKGGSGGRDLVEVISVSFDDEGGSDLYVFKVYITDIYCGNLHY